MKKTICTILIVAAFVLCFPRYSLRINIFRLAEPLSVHIHITNTCAEYIAVVNAVNRKSCWGCDDERQDSPEAVTDLQQAKAYITEELCNEQAAVDTIAYISGFPESGAPLSSIVGFETDYRILVCGNDTALDRIENQTVNIVRVLYGRRNSMQILFGEPSDN